MAKADDYPTTPHDDRLIFLSQYLDRLGVPPRAEWLFLRDQLFRRQLLVFCYDLESPNRLVPSPVKLWDPSNIFIRKKSYITVKEPLPGQMPERLSRTPLRMHSVRYLVRVLAPLTLDLSAPAEPTAEKIARAEALNKPAVGKVDVDNAIRDEIRKVYSEAKEAHTKPPNLRELPALVQPHMKTLGHPVSATRVMSIGKEKEFSALRLPRGPRWRD